MRPTGTTRIRPLVDLLLRGRVVLLIAALLTLYPAWRLSERLQFDQSVESLFAPDDPHLLAYERSKELFGGDAFVIVAWEDPDLFRPGSSELTGDSARRLRELTADLNAVPGVNASSTQSLLQALQNPLIRRQARELVERMLVGRDGRTTAVVLRLMETKSAPVSRGETIRRIREIAAEFARAEDLPVLKGDRAIFVVGEPVQVHDMFRYVEEDGATFFWWSLGLLAVVIAFLFRSVRWMLLPLLVVVTSILWTRATLVLSGLKLSMVSSMLNSLTTIIAIATVMHITVHYRRLRPQLPRGEALRQALIDLLPAIGWTCVTTAVGFGALTSSSIQPVRSFGLMMSLAAGMVLLASISLVPGGALTGRWSADPRATPAEGRLMAWLQRAIRLVEKRPGLVGLVLLGMVIATALGFLRLEVETDFSRNFRRDSPIVQSLQVFETDERFHGAGTWEVNFPAPLTLNDAYLTRVRKLAADLRALNRGETERLSKVVAITDGLDLVPRLPLFSDTIPKRLKFVRTFQPEFESSLYNRSARRMRIMLRAPEQQPSATKLQLIAEAEQAARAAFPEDEFPGEPPAVATGLYVLLAFIIESLLRDQWISFLIAAAGIVLAMTVAFRSLAIGLLSLLPNLFPIVCVVGAMGWIGLPVNIATAMIASVSVGLTVDGTIHYLAGFQRARHAGLSVSEALRATQQDIGRAIVFANLALVVGFLVLTLSHFIPLVHFGVLVSVSMLGGVIADLLLLPMLLHWLAGDDDQTPSDAAA